MPSTITQTVAARIPNEHADRLAAIADWDGRTISATLASIVAEKLGNDPCANPLRDGNHLLGVQGSAEQQRSREHSRSTSDDGSRERNILKPRCSR